MTNNWVIMSDDKKIPPHPAESYNDAIAKATQLALGKPGSGVHVYQHIALVRSETKASIEFSPNVEPERA